MKSADRIMNTLDDEELHSEIRKAFEEIKAPPYEKLQPVLEQEQEREEIILYA